MAKKLEEPNLFTYLNQVQTKNRKYPYDKKIASAWMLSLWLSQDKEYIYHVNDINQYLFYLPDDIVYEYYMGSIPKKQRVKFIKWTKKRKDDEDFKKQIEKLQENYPEMSTRECKMRLTFDKILRDKNPPF